MFLYDTRISNPKDLPMRLPISSLNLNPVAATVAGTIHAPEEKMPAIPCLEEILP